MPCLKRKLAALALVLCAALVPSASFASTSCDCWCGSVGKGADDSAGMMTQDKCEAACSDKGKQLVGCFTDPAQYPYENDKCWTKDECASFADDRGGETVRATWQTTIPYDCSPTKSGTEMRYCYANDVPYDLNIHIGNVAEVENLPAYINAMYAWLLPAASLVAVVMMMIGGLQYTLARGKPKYIDKAKTRITNAITGVVILLSAFVILNLIDPRLTNLDTLKIPLIKEVVILDPASSCERLEDYGYDVKLTTGTEEVCGSKGTIEDNTGLKDNALGSWKVGDTCDYLTCKTTGTSCGQIGETNLCLSCAGNTAPSESMCASLEQTNTGPQSDQNVYCRYDVEGSHTSSSGTLEDGACFGVQNASGSSSEQYLDCSVARAQAAKPSGTAVNEDAGCEYYETLEITAYPLNGSINTEEYKDVLQEICNADPCELAKLVGASKCAYNEGADMTNTFWTALWATVTNQSPTGTTGYYCHTF